MDITAEDVKVLQSLVRVARLLQQSEASSTTGSSSAPCSCLRARHFSRSLADFADLSAAPNLLQQLNGEHVSARKRGNSAGHAVAEEHHTSVNDDDDEDLEEEDTNDDDRDDILMFDETDEVSVVSPSDARKADDIIPTRPHAAVEKRYRSVIQGKIEFLHALIPASGTFSLETPSAGSLHEKKKEPKSVVLDRTIRYIHHLVSTYESFELEVDVHRKTLQRWLDG